MPRLLFGGLAVVASVMLAQNAPAQDVPRVEETVSVGYVMIPFTVLGDRGAPITDLRRGEVRLLVDGKRVPSDMFEKSQNAPVSFTILIDASGSMALGGKMDAARAAIGALLAHRRPGDDFSLFEFAESEAHELVPFTEDSGAITRALATVTPYGKTAFFDALSTMPERSRLGKNPSRAIILLSDGIDNASKLTRADLAARLQGESVPIYPLGIRDPHELSKPVQTKEELSDLEILDAVANFTGGKLYLGNQPQQIALAVASIEKDLRAQYLIGFTPTGQGGVKYRRISLQLAGRVHTVRVRAGYFGTEPPLVAVNRERKKS